MASTDMAASELACELPSLTLQVVGSFLPPRSVGNCRLVCRQWRTAFAACVDVIYLRVYLEPDLTNVQIAAAASIFPSASCAVLLLPNSAHLTCNVYDSDGAAVAGPPLGRRSIAANRARHDALQSNFCKQAPLASPSVTFPAAVVDSISALTAPQVGTDLADRPYTRAVSASAEAASSLPPQDAGQAAFAAALRSLRWHLPLLKTVQVGDANRPMTRPGPEATLEQCLIPEEEAVSSPCFLGSQAAPPKGSSYLAASGSAATKEAAITSMGGPSNKSEPCLAEHSKILVENACVVTVRHEASFFGSCWGYPATLLPPEGAVVWESHTQVVAQIAAEQAVEAAHRASLDLLPLILPAPLPSLASLDLRCPVDLEGLLANGTDSGGAGNKWELMTALTALTALTVLQLRDSSQLATLRQLPHLALVDLWCCDGSSRRGTSYWMSAAPQRIRRGLPLLATALTALTALVLRGLAAQVEPPPPVAALATLPLLSSLTLELVYDDPWPELMELAEQLDDHEDDFEDGSEEDKEDGHVAEPLKAAGTLERKEEGRRTVVWDTAAAAPSTSAVLDLCIREDSWELKRRGFRIVSVVGSSWRYFRDSLPLDLFSYFADRRGGGCSGESDNAAETTAATSGARAPTHASLTELDVTFLGAGLLPGAWHGICQLGSGLTRLALRVARSPLEERLISNLQARTPGCWPPGSFSVHSLESLPHLRHLLLDVPMESQLAAALAARALNVPAGMLPSMQLGQEQPSSLTVASGLESLAVVGMWSRTGCTGAAFTSSAAGAAPETAGTCGRSKTVQLPLASLALHPVWTMLRAVNLDGDLQHLVSDMAGRVLSDLNLVDLRLAHRPVGRPSQRSFNDGASNLVGSSKLLHGRLRLLWTQLPPNLHLLDLEGFDVHIDDSSHDDTVCTTDLLAVGGCTADAGSAPSRQLLLRLERLRLRHCAVMLGGVYYSPLEEVAVKGCWLIPTRAVTVPPGTTPPTETVTPWPPWDATGQLGLLCQQPWAPRLVRLELQLIRLPCNVKVWAATEGAVGTAAQDLGFRPCGSRPCSSADGTTVLDYALPGAACISRLCGLGHLSITWELEALSPSPQAQRELAELAELADPWPRTPSVGLTPDLASRLVSLLPDGLRSLELYLGDEQQEQPLSVDNCCGPWLLRLQSLRRLRLVLAVSSTRGATHGSAAKAIRRKSRYALERRRYSEISSGSDTSDSSCGGWVGSGGHNNRTVRGASGGGRTTENPEVSEPSDGLPCEGDTCGEDGNYVGGESHSGQHAAGATSSAQLVRPLVASAWVHSELADLIMRYLPYCQCNIVQVRLD
ncbi:hypothetical protein VaNZ11_007280 [Volvox africanus]|uniref:F-box domain-containing protein n=1 Tax=Volvox africanus TaxID=51714 RepID=A0ABQ5S357_9CHLO|nr:hypothetical protein VaNZ11_007280 [Volvox africanus]